MPKHSAYGLIRRTSHSNLRTKFKFISNAGLDLMSRLLTYDPAQRITAEEALDHPYFKCVLACQTVPLNFVLTMGSFKPASSLRREAPLPKHPDLFGSFPSLAAGEK